LLKGFDMKPNIFESNLNLKQGNVMSLILAYCVDCLQL
jgi:hypothetical protein